MKKKLQLSTLIKIQKNLEGLVLTKQKYIQTYNDTEINVLETLDAITEAEDELVKIKEVIQEANKQKHEDGHTNNYWIYCLSNLNQRKKFLEEVKTTDKSQLKESDRKAHLAKIDEKINDIRAKLTEFNTREVSFEMNEKVLAVL
jgi:hypothetical protein